MTKVFLRRSEGYPVRKNIAQGFLAKSVPTEVEMDDVDQSLKYGAGYLLVGKWFGKGKKV